MESRADVPTTAAGRHPVLVGLLDERFTAWWAAFLVHALETLKAFRVYGDDERQILVWALAVRALDGAMPGALSLTELAAMTGIPVETARRHLLRLAQDGQCRRVGALYAIDMPEVLRAAIALQARALVRVLRRALPRDGAPVPSESDALTPDAVRAALVAGLAYCANLRSRVTRGVFLPCFVAGMLEIEGAVRLRCLLEGDLALSRRNYLEIVHRMNWIVIYTARIAQLAGEPMARARAAVRYAGDLGFGTMVSADHFAYSADAAQVLREERGVICGVLERLADLLVAAGAAPAA